LLLSGVSNVFAPAGDIASKIREIPKLFETNQEKKEGDQKILEFKADYVELFLLKTLQSALRQNKAFDIEKSIDEFLKIESLGVSGLSDVFNRNQIKNQIVDNLRENGLLKINEVLSSESFTEEKYNTLDVEVRRAVAKLYTKIADQIDELKARSFARRDLTNRGAYKGLSETSFDKSVDKALAIKVLDLAKKFGFKIVTDEDGNVMDIQDNENINIMRQKFLKEIASQMYSTSEKEVMKSLVDKSRQNPRIGKTVSDKTDEDFYKKGAGIVDGEESSHVIGEPPMTIEIL